MDAQRAVPFWEAAETATACGRPCHNLRVLSVLWSEAGILSWQTVSQAQRLTLHLIVAEAWIHATEVRVEAVSIRE
jgi:hypothetical protein